jgi:tetratricopeptide (TPR) repeat protein
MPNGTDCSCLLQTEPQVTPTQWLVFDLTADGRCLEWIRHDQTGAIDYVPLRGGEPTLPVSNEGDAAKQALIEVRPTATRALLDSYARRCEAGSGGRLVMWFIGDVADPLSRQLLAELPMDLSNLIFWESGNVPAVIRGCLSADDEARRALLSMLHDQYFIMPPFSDAYYGEHISGQLYGNEFDSCLLSADDDRLRHVIEHLVPLHVEETAYAVQHAEPRRGGGLLIIEDTLQDSLRWRKIDWLAVAMYPYFPRLWEAGEEDFLDVLDYARCGARRADPWAALRRHSRERNWDHLQLTAHYDLARLEQPYRISPGDVRSRLPLTGFLLRRGHPEEALRQCELAAGESEEELAPAWLKMEGLARHELNHEDQARALFVRYRERLMAGTDASAATFDEISSTFLMEDNWERAVEYARKAIDSDPHFLHAYDALVIAARAMNQPELEEHARRLAEEHGVRIPIHVHEE